MKIGYDAKRAFCNNTGLGNYSRMLIESIARCGEETMLYTPREKTAHTQALSALPRTEISAPRGMWKLMPAMWRSLAIGQKSKRDGVALFHGLSHELPLFLPKSMPAVVTMHDLIVRRYPEYFSLVDRMVHRIKQRHACHRADVVIAISEQTRNDIIQMMHIDERKVKVVYQSCDSQFWQPIDETTIAHVRQKYKLPQRYFVCVGTVEERKNQISAIHAMQLMPADVQLIIVGRKRGKYGKRVAQEIERCGLAHRVRIVEKADFADFPALYAGAVASVYVSRFEGFGIPVLESICCDCPVITANSSSLPEAGGEAALYVAPDDEAALAKAMSTLLSDTSLRQQMIERGRKHKESFTSDRIANQLLALYHDLV